VAALVDFAVNMVDDVVDLFLALGESLREVICELFHVTCARILARSRRAESFDSAGDLASERCDFISNIVQRSIDPVALESKFNNMLKNIHDSNVILVLTQCEGKSSILPSIWQSFEYK
jgi:hypothetical protein